MPRNRERCRNSTVIEGRNKSQELNAAHDPARPVSRSIGGLSLRKASRAESEANHRIDSTRKDRGRTAGDSSDSVSRSHLFVFSSSLAFVMKLLVVASRGWNRTEFVALKATAATWATMAGCALVLVGCASEPEHTAGSGGGRYFDAKLGVWASPAPRGGRRNGCRAAVAVIWSGALTSSVARPITRTPSRRATPWSGRLRGMAMRSTAGAPPTAKSSTRARSRPRIRRCPCRAMFGVTNLKNNKSMIVRVNDRGPYHGGRVMDVSQRVAEALSFKGEGTARIRVDYIGRASLTGSDDEKLMADPAG